MPLQQEGDAFLWAGPCRAAACALVRAGRAPCHDRMRMQLRMEAVEAARRAEVNGSVSQAWAHRESCERACPPVLLVSALPKLFLGSIVLLFFGIGAG